MQAVGCGFVLLPQSGLGFVSVPRILLAGDVSVEHRLVLEFIAAESPGERVLRPDNLAAHLEAGRLDRILEFALR